ncbi:MAG: hypothetical protein ABR589_01595 [Chthoniobacterales bacterium]
MRAPLNGFPWPLGFGLIGFFIAFVVQFRLKHHIDRDKVLAIEDMSELYPNGIPPKKILTDRGRRLHLWLQIGAGVFVASILLTMLLYAR